MSKTIYYVVEPCNGWTYFEIINKQIKILRENLASKNAAKFEYNIIKHGGKIRHLADVKLIITSKS